jgi:hypothetical protein
VLFKNLHFFEQYGKPIPEIYYDALRVKRLVGFYTTHGPEQA